MLTLTMHAGYSCNLSTPDWRPEDQEFKVAFGKIGSQEFKVAFGKMGAAWATQDPESTAINP